MGPTCHDTLLSRLHCPVILPGRHRSGQDWSVDAQRHRHQALLQGPTLQAALPPARKGLGDCQLAPMPGGLAQHLLLMCIVPASGAFMMIEHLQQDDA